MIHTEKFTIAPQRIYIKKAKVKHRFVKGKKVYGFYGKGQEKDFRTK